MHLEAFKIIIVSDVDVLFPELAVLAKHHNCSQDTRVLPFTKQKK